MFMTTKARYIMIGGFLGAGKTTSVARLARRLTDRGLRVGLITNDQGNELVDTAMLRSHGFATEEIPGGCFCCRFNSLVDAADRLSASARPDVFIAEPVGSCTDLVATVTYPLRRMYGDSFSIAPLSVLVDPVRALRIFGLEPGGKFSDKVLYIYRKQLEEADLIVINKCDLVSEARLAALRQAIIANFPEAELVQISARDGTGLDFWFNRISDGDQPSGLAMEVDYETYADGEALLGWLNCTAQLSVPDSFEANSLLTQLATYLQQQLSNQGAEVAHLKMTLSPDEGLGDIAVINLVRNDFIPELSQELPDPIASGQLIINLRAESSPGTLNNAVQAALEHCRREHPKLTIALEHLEHFRPGKPTPTHRIANLT
jgi:G3E family GTPase